LSEGAHRIALVVLAAGQSRRFGVANKLLTEIDGQPMIARLLGELVGTGREPITDIDRVLVVVPPDCAPLQAAIGMVQTVIPVRIVVNNLADTGMGSSIACAISQLGGDATGAVITPADMPSLSRAHIAALMAAYVGAEGWPVVHAVFSDGTPTSPMIWPRRSFAALAGLTGDVGGRSVLATFDAIGVRLDDDVGLADIDTPADLASWQGRSKRD
jgi:molybdenum cofactor cytidylyltransferase